MHISSIKAGCEETESHLKATTKNLNYYVLKEAFSKREKNKQKLADLTGFELRTFCMEDEIHTAAPTKRINILNIILNLVSRS